MRTAACRCGDRSDPPGPRPCAEPRRVGVIARGVARACARRPNSRGGTEPAWTVGADGHDAVRSRTAIFALTVNASPARDMVHPDRVGRGALRAADRSSLVPAFGSSLGTQRRDHVGAVCWGASRGGDKAGLPGDSSSRKETRAEPQTGAETRVGPVSRRSRADISLELHLMINIMKMRICSLAASFCRCSVAPYCEDAEGSALIHWRQCGPDLVTPGNDPVKFNASPENAAGDLLLVNLHS